MKDSEQYNYERIAKAIDYIKDNYDKQPNLDEIAQHLNMSPFHFQRLFSDWAGLSPKKFLQYISINYAKQMLRDNDNTLFETAINTGLSGTGRLHDLFIKIEGMTPAEYKNDGENLIIFYQFYDTIFGQILIANTEKGVCKISFIDDRLKAEEELFLAFKKASFLNRKHPNQEKVMKIFNSSWENLEQIKLHLKGTDFQLKVWGALLKIPFARLSTYSNIANEINHPKASRAVGTAIGNNPIAFLIPCHRVIQTSGNIGGYMWGNTRKKAIIAWEASKDYK